MMFLILLLVLGTALLLVLAMGNLWSAATAQRGMVELVARPDERRGLAAFRPIFDRRLQRTRPGAWIQVALEETGLQTLRAGDAVLLAVAVTVVAAIVVGVVLSWLLAPLVVIAVVPAAVAVVRRQQDRRREAFIGQMPQLARILSNATAAGLSLRTAVEIAAEELPLPASAEMGRIANAFTVGESLERAMGSLERRLPSREVAVLTSTLVVSSRTGGSLVSSLRKIADTLEERKQTRREVRTLLSEARSTAILIPIIGVTSLAMINGLGDNTLDRMLRQPVGQAIMVGALVMYVLGGFLFRRVTRVDV
jgi:tight adherence protein B